MTKLATTTVGSGGTATVTFSNIPQGYTDLVIKASYRSNRADGDYGNMGIRFNNDTLAASYFSKYMFGYNRTATSGLDSGTNSYIRLGGASQATQTTLTFTNNEIYVHDYSGNNIKGVISEWGSENNGQMNFLGISTGYWNSSAPITSLSVFFDAGAGEFLIENSTFVLYGIKKAVPLIVKASGGTITFDGNDVVHTFLSSDTLRVTQPIFAQCLLVAGGGGGGGRHGGGGGGGGMVEIASVFMPTGSYAAVVGAGAALRTTTGNGYSGSDSSLFSNIAYGGGGGGAYTTGNAPDGGSTGGDGYGTLGGTTATKGLIVNGTGATYGNVKMIKYYTGVNGVGGGGAGVGGVKDFANGGAGRQNNIDGKNYYYGGGGGGSAWETYAGSNPFLIGGLGGGGGGGSAAVNISPSSNFAGGTGGRNLGGNGKTGTNGSAGESGTGGNGGANTGGGGGGSGQLEDSGYSGYGGGGGSGIVIIRYKG
jgi:hypothetical protein